MLDKIKQFFKKTPKEKILSSVVRFAISVICVIFVLVLIVNITLIVKSYTKKQEMPSFMGYVPVIVCVDDMAPILKSGDLAICKHIDTKDIRIDDVISFYNTDLYGDTVVTAKVMSIKVENDIIFFQTNVLNENSLNAVLVQSKDVVGIYKFKFIGLGKLLLFMQSTAGLILFVIIPIALFMAYEIIFRMRYERVKEKETQELISQLEQLKQEASDLDESEEQDNTDFQ